MKIRLGSNVQYKLDVERARELLKYDPLTGWLTWRTGGGRKVVGSRAGHRRRSDGYRVIRVDGVLYGEHRVIWLLVTGSWPESEIDHINLCHGDNTWLNLRPATDSGQNGNQALRVDNKSGFRGVSWSRKAGKWAAQILRDGRKKFLGYFDDPSAAYAVYKMHAINHFGEFYRDGK